MKKVLCFIFTFIMLLSCETAEYITAKNIDTLKPMENNFSSSKFNVENILSGEEIISKIKKDVNLKEEDQLKNISLRELSNDEKSEEQKSKRMYVLRGKTDKGVSIAHVFTANPDNTLLMSEGLTCKCTSTNCSQGCDASIWGGNCSCSHCSSECKKESTVTQEFKGLGFKSKK